MLSDNNPIMEADVGGLDDLTIEKLTEVMKAAKIERLQVVTA